MIGRPLSSIPDALIEPGAGKVSHILVVEMDSQSMLMYEYNGGRFIVKDSFEISTGERIGEKEEEGDRKTPEGFYIFNNKYIERELAPIYGIMAFPIDYPNFLDLRLGKTGSGIWLHGSNRKLLPRDSNGCIALNNIDLLRLEDIIQLQDTPIIIYDKVEYEPVEKIRNEAARIKTFVESWRRAWEGKDISRYRSFYDREFTNNVGIDYAAWMSKKSRLALKYKKISIRLDNLRIFKHQGLVVVIFNQNYQSDSYSNIGEKRLYLVQRKGDYKISSEVWKPIPPKMAPKKLPMAVRNRVVKEAQMASLTPSNIKAGKKEKIPSALAEREKIRKLLEDWLKDWSAEDRRSYFSHYHPNFRLRNINQDLNLKAFKKHKTLLFNRYSDINIGVKNLKINVNRTQAEVTFIQDFRSRQYQDRGLKKLVLVKFQESWRIKEESWFEIRAGGKP